VTNTNNANTFIMAIFTAGDFDATCNGPAADNIYDGVAYNFGTLPTGCWYSLICLDGTGLFHQMPTDGSGAYIAVYLSSLDPVTLYPEACQPLLWGTKPNNPSQQGPIQWDDVNPTDGQLTNNECFNYGQYQHLSLVRWVPRWRSGLLLRDASRITAMWTATAVSTTPTCSRCCFAFGNSGSNPSDDVNCDGVVDDADLLNVLFNFGNGC
jgi:hypothetical protein